MLYATAVWADETADRAAITRTISTFDASSAPELARLQKPTVTISHEPWGEADVRIPGSRVALGALTFVTPEVALADASYSGAPVLLVMKKEQGSWKISSVRILANAP
jgi:hypothetical protein